MRRRAGKIAVLVPEPLLHAHVDVLLPPGKRRAVDAAIANDPELTDTVNAWRRQNLRLRQLSAQYTPPPMPRDMAYAMQRLQRSRAKRRPGTQWQVAAALLLLAVGSCLWMFGPGGNALATRSLYGPADTATPGPLQKFDVLETSGKRHPEPAINDPEPVSPEGETADMPRDS